MITIQARDTTKSFRVAVLFLNPTCGSVGVQVESREIGRFVLFCFVLWIFPNLIACVLRAYPNLRCSMDFESYCVVLSLGSIGYIADAKGFSLTHLWFTSSLVVAPQVLLRLSPLASSFAIRSQFKPLDLV